MRRSVLVVMAALALSGCSANAAARQVQPALPGRWGLLGETYVLVTPTQVDPEAVSFNVSGQVGVSVRAQICTHSGVDTAGSAGRLVYCRWSVDKANDNIGQLRFTIAAQSSPNLQVTLRTGSAHLSLSWVPSGFFGGHGAG